MSPIYQFTNLLPGARLHVDGLVQDYSNSSALAMELLQSCTKPSVLDLLWPQPTIETI